MRRVWRFVASEDEMQSLFEDLNQSLYDFCENNDGKKLKVELLITKEKVVEVKHE